MVIAPRVSARATQPIGRRGDCYHLVTAVERSRSANVAYVRSPPSSNMAPSRSTRSARAVSWQAPMSGFRRVSRSAAAGQDVGPGAQAPRTGPFGCPELAAPDLRAAALALIGTGNFDILGFLATRHIATLPRAIREVEFSAFGFFERAPLRRKRGGNGAESLLHQPVCCHCCRNVCLDRPLDLGECLSGWKFVRHRSDQQSHEVGALSPRIASPGTANGSVRRVVDFLP